MCDLLGMLLIAPGCNSNIPSRMKKIHKIIDSLGIKPHPSTVTMIYPPKANPKYQSSHIARGKPSLPTVPTVSIDPESRTCFSTARANSAAANPASFLLTKILQSYHLSWSNSTNVKYANFLWTQKFIAAKAYIYTK